MEAEAEAPSKFTASKTLITPFFTGASLKVFEVQYYERVPKSDTGSLGRKCMNFERLHRCKYEQ